MTGEEDLEKQREKDANRMPFCYRENPGLFICNMTPTRLKNHNELHHWQAAVICGVWTGKGRRKLRQFGVESVGPAARIQKGEETG